MWLIGLGVAIALLLVGFFSKKKPQRKILLLIGSLILVLSLGYGALVMLLLGGIS